LGRRWIAFEQDKPYLAASAFRFINKEQPIDIIQTTYQNLLRSVETTNFCRTTQLMMFDEKEDYTKSS